MALAARLIRSLDRLMIHSVMRPGMIRIN